MQVRNKTYKIKHTWSASMYFPVAALTKEVTLCNTTFILGKVLYI